MNNALDLRLHSLEAQARLMALFIQKSFIFP